MVKTVVRNAVNIMLLVESLLFIPMSVPKCSSKKFKGTLIQNANAVSLTDSFNESLSMLTLHQIQCKFLV